MRRVIIIFFAVFIATTAFSQEVPNVQTRFLGLEFGENQQTVYSKLFSDGYRIINAPLNSYLVESVYFGGRYWTFCRFGFAKETLVSFSAFLEYPKEKGYQLLFYDLLSSLKRKYPMKNLSSSDPKFYHYYKDTQGNGVSLFLNDSSIVLSYESYLKEQKKQEELDEF